MTRAGTVFVGVAALAQLAVWVVVRPDLAGPQWTAGDAFQMWLGIEALTAVVVGCVAPARRMALLAVGAGWVPQVVHFAVLGQHYDDDGLWAVGLFLQVALGAVAAGVAVLAHTLVGRLRRRGSRSAR
jgi:hypothetical protein